MFFFIQVFSQQSTRAQRSRRRVRFSTPALLQTRSTWTWHVWRAMFLCCRVVKCLHFSFRSSPEETEMDSGADSTTHCQSEGTSSAHWLKNDLEHGSSVTTQYYNMLILITTSVCVCVCMSEETSQLGFLELSQTQDLCSEAVNSRGGDCERRNKLGIFKIPFYILLFYHIGL